MNKNYDQAVARGSARHGDRFDTSDLDPRFAPFYGTATRIKVRTGYGEELTGYVGMTSGWRPHFLLLHSTRSRGSSVLLGVDTGDDPIVAVKHPGCRQYRPFVRGDFGVGVR